MDTEESTKQARLIELGKAAVAWRKSDLDPEVDADKRLSKLYELQRVVDLLIVTPGYVQPVVTPRVDLLFRLSGTEIPIDHGYALFGAVCRVVGNIHGAPWIAIAPIRGHLLTQTVEFMYGSSELRIRIEPGMIPQVLPLRNKELELDGYKFFVKDSQVEALRPATDLFSPMVTIKGFVDPESFREAVIRQLTALEVKARVEVGCRRTMTVSGNRVVGFGVALHDLSEDDSLKVQYHGVGGKQRMGCGVFLRFDSYTALNC
jgi:CRISPR-associated endonuclease/helicase Cas3